MITLIILLAMSSANADSRVRQVPMVVDSNGISVGRVMGHKSLTEGHTDFYGVFGNPWISLYFDGRLHMINISSDGPEKTKELVYYETTDCTGQPYVHVGIELNTLMPLEAVIGPNLRTGSGTDEVYIIDPTYTGNPWIQRYWDEQSGSCWPSYDWDNVYPIHYQFKFSDYFTPPFSISHDQNHGGH